MKRHYIWLWILPALLIAQIAAAQQSELQLRLRRDFGYSSGSGDIQGTFSMRISGPDDLARVIFTVDGNEIGRADQPPFQLRFSTDSFTLGPHVLAARGYTASGIELQSNAIQVNFVSADESWQAGMRIMIPMLAITFGIILLSAVISIVSGRKLQNIAPGSPRNYGIAGGAICSRCGRPFPRHFLSPNLIFGKLARCPFCGKWAIVPAASPDALRRAELAELEGAHTGVATEFSDEELLRKSLDDSRYQDF